MKNIKLNNGIEIPSVGMGVFRIEDQAQAQQTVESALSVGYRHIDTAMIYGNEEAVGKAIANSGIVRSELFVTTKLWNDDQRSGKVEEAIDQSLKRMGLDYVDLYLVHWPVKGTYVDVWKKMEAIYRSGKCRAIGVSNYLEHQLDELLKISDVTPAVNQIECFPYFTQEPLIKYCQSKDIHIESWGPLGAGQTKLFDDSVIVAIADKHSKTPAQVVIRWHLQRGLIVIPKSAHKERQAQNLDVFSFHLTDDDMKQISALNKSQRLGPDPDNFDF